MRVMEDKRKGQAALEYLVTYGWAILAIVIVAAVLWYLGLFNPNKYTGNKQCGGFSALSCADYTAVGGNVTLKFGNAAGSAITVTNATCVPTSPTSVAPNAQFWCTASVATTASTDVPITIVYTVTQSGLSHSETGFVRGQGA